MNAQAAIPVLLQLFRASSGDPTAIAGLIARGGEAIARLRSARTNAERGAALDELQPMLKEAGAMLGFTGGLSPDEITSSLAELDSVDSKFDTIHDFTPGGKQ